MVSIIYGGKFLTTVEMMTLMMRMKTILLRTDVQKTARTRDSTTELAEMRTEPNNLVSSTQGILP